jgi:hypothetical protein
VNRYTAVIDRSRNCERHPLVAGAVEGLVSRQTP